MCVCVGKNALASVYNRARADDARLLSSLSEFLSGSIFLLFFCILLGIVVRAINSCGGRGAVKRRRKRSEHQGRAETGCARVTDM